MEMMDVLQSVVIQDAAVMLHNCPGDCAHHGLFQLPVFQSQTFTEYMNGMKCHLEESQAPYYNARIDQVLPGVHSRMDSLGSNLNYIRHKKVDKHKMQMETMPTTIQEVLHFFGKNAMKLVTMSSSFLSWRSSTRAQMTPPAAILTMTMMSPSTEEEAHSQLLHILFAMPLVLVTVSQAKPQSATDVCDASWHGIGPYKNKPMQGGRGVLSAGAANCDIFARACRF